MDFRDKLELYGTNYPKHELDEKRMLITFEIDDGEDEPKVYTLKCQYEVCEYCEGRGKYVNPAIDSHGITQEEFDDDPGFEEDYFSGRYDVVCKGCRGKRVRPEPILLDGDEASKAWKDWIEDMEGYAREREYERRWGC